MDKKREVVQEVGNYLVVKTYADTLYTNGQPYYGDIYSSEADVLKDHPGAEVMHGFGFVDKETGYQPDDAPDWFDSVEETVEYIGENH